MWVCECVGGAFYNYYNNHRTRPRPRPLLEVEVISIIKKKKMKLPTGIINNKNNIIATDDEWVVE